MTFKVKRQNETTKGESVDEEDQALRPEISYMTRLGRRGANDEGDWEVEKLEDSENVSPGNEVKKMCQRDGNDLRGQIKKIRIEN